MPVANSVRSYRGPQEARTNSKSFAQQSAKTGLAGFFDYILAAALMTGALVFYVYLHVSTLAIGYELSQTRHEQLNLLRENRALKTEVGSLAAPSRIRKIANEKMGMHPARKIERIKGAP